MLPPSWQTKQAKSPLIDRTVAPQEEILIALNVDATDILAVHLMIPPLGFIGDFHF